MSFYATIHARLVYESQTVFDNALVELGDYVDAQGYLVDECDDRISDEPNVDRQSRVIEIPFSSHRNLARILERLFQGATGKAVWTSTDGCFEGGVIVNGEETIYDLAKWAADNVEGDAPNVEEQFDEWVEWSVEVEAAFFDEFDN